MDEYQDRLKHIFKKIVGRPDPHWQGRFFEYAISRKSIAKHAGISAWADEACRLAIDDPHTDDPVVIQGRGLRNKVMRDYKGSQADRGARILVHMPGEKASLGGYSLLGNLAEALSFIGVQTSVLGWNEPIAPILDRAEPNIFITGDHASYLNRIDWDAIQRYRSKNALFVGLTASLREYGNSPLPGRLKWAKDHGVDFYYSFREQDYLHERKEYIPFFEAGYEIFSVQFGANPLAHFPVSVPGMERDLDYAFLASNQIKIKGERHYEYLKKIVSGYQGFIDGPGWKHSPDFHFNRHRDRYIYARARAGLNMHIEDQTHWANETNERTYQLAACGVPQVTDHAGVLNRLFGPGSLFVADSPKEYLEHFRFIMAHPQKARKQALKAQREVFEKYTTFHRASDFVTKLSNHYGLGSR